jgi:hypothetical protein
MVKTRTLNELRQVKTFGYKSPKVKKMAKKSKYMKRRAIECKIVERSKSNPGYCKYMITIAEMDGTIHKQPAYGKDMQGALSRLINKERTSKVERNTGAGMMFIAWMIVMGVPAFYMEKYGSPVYMLYGFLGVGALIGLVAWWHNYITKGE